MLEFLSPHSRAVCLCFVKCTMGHSATCALLLPYPFPLCLVSQLCSYTISLCVAWRSIVILRPSLRGCTARISFDHVVYNQRHDVSPDQYAGMAFFHTHILSHTIYTVGNMACARISLRVCRGTSSAVEVACVVQRVPCPNVECRYRSVQSRHRQARVTPNMGICQ